MTGLGVPVIFKRWCVAAAVAFSASLLTAALAGPVLNVTPITWNVIGLDSNDVNSGPNVFPVGVRVCNTGDAAALSVTASFVRTGATNSFITLQGASSVTVDSLSFGSAPPSPYTVGNVPANCADFYFNVVVTRSSAAYNTRQGYRIDVAASGLGAVSTPTPRELYVEKLVSQGRNSVQSFTGPTSVFVGQTYQYTVSASTATGGYEQLENFPNFPNTIFRIVNVSSTYSAPAGAVNSTVYADACGWVNDPSSPDYHNNRSCNLADNYPGGKAGGSIMTTYTVKILSAGVATVTNAIYDYSGSSYHYNSDYGNTVLAITAQNPPLPDLGIAKSHSGAFMRGGSGTYTLSVGNVGPGVTSGAVTVTDTLPAGLTPSSASGSGWSCTIAAQTVTCTRADSLAAGASYPAITLAVNVAQGAPASLTNTATVSGGGQTNTANDSSSDPTSILSQADLSVTKTDSQTSEIPGTSVSYTLTVGNAGPSNVSGATVTDTFPSTITGIAWTCTASSGSSCPASGSGNIAASVSLLSGGSATFTATGNIASGATGTLANTATVTASSGATDPVSANNAATDTDTLTPQADLSLTKTGPASATPGGSIAYTLTVTNPGPSDAVNVTVSDATPTGLTFVSNSGACATAFPCALGTLAPGASRTITATFLAPANYGGPNPILNTATVSSPTADPNAGNNAAQTVTALTGTSVSGRVYHDLEPNALREPGETWATGSSVFVNLVQGGTVIRSAQVVPGGGTYSLSGIAPGSYTLLIAATATATTPSAPAGWLFVSPDGSRSLSVGSGNVAGQDFGLFHGSKVTGRVFRDDGRSGGVANDARQNGGEAGLANAIVSAHSVSSLRSAATDALGAYTLYLPYTWTSPITLSHPMTPATGTNIGGNSVSLASSYADAGAARRSINPFSSGSAYAGYNFGVVGSSAFKPDQSSQTTSPGSVSYRHLYHPGTLGAITLLQSGGGYGYRARRDANCDGDFADAGETFQALPLSFSVTAAWPREVDGSLAACALEVQVIVPAGEAAGAVDIASVSATLAWLNKTAVGDARTVVDTTTVVVQGGLRLEKQVRNVSRGSSFGDIAGGSPGEVLEYCVSYQNVGVEVLTALEVSDPLPFFTDFLAGAYGSGRDIRWTRHGDGTVLYLSAAAGDDEGMLVGTAVRVLGGALAEVEPGERGEVCFQARIR